MLKLSGSIHNKVLQSSEEKAVKTYDELMVIGAGLPRTGTLSLKTALTQLYQARCYHMVDVFNGDQADIDIWLKGMTGHVAPEEWRQFFSSKGYACGVDYPFSCFWKDLIAVYPNAKVILSVRDPKSWYKSVTESIYQFQTLIQTSWTIPLLFKMIDRRKNAGAYFQTTMFAYKPNGLEMSMGEAIAGGPQVAEQFFKDWETMVRKVVPPERLLVHAAKEGWEPLCKFLGLPVPDVPYPRVNDTATIQKGVRSMKRLNFMVFYVLPTMVALGCYYSQDWISCAVLGVASFCSSRLGALFG